MFTFHTKADTLATHSTLADASAYAWSLAPTVARGTVSVTLPNGGELALSSFGRCTHGVLLSHMGCADCIDQE